MTIFVVIPKIWKRILILLLIFVNLIKLINMIRFYLYPLYPRAYRCVLVNRILFSIDSLYQLRENTDRLFRGESLKLY